MTTLDMVVQGAAASASATPRPSSRVRGTAKIVHYVLRDVTRGRWLVGYAAFFLLLTEALIRFGGGGAQVLLSVANVTLLATPLIGIVFGTMYLYNAREFNELLLAQPVDRRQLFAGRYLGLALPLVLALAVGVGLPVLVHGVTEARDRVALAVLLAMGAGLTVAYLASAFVIAMWTDDRVRGLGAAIAVWLVSTVLYDGAVLRGATTLADYPLEQAMLALMLLNP